MRGDPFTFTAGFESSANNEVFATRHTSDSTIFVRYSNKYAANAAAIGSDNGILIEGSDITFSSDMKTQYEHCAHLISIFN